AVRRVRDIRTGRWTAPSLDGTPVVFPDGREELRGIRPVTGLRGAVTRAMAPYAALPQSPRDALAIAVRSVVDKLRR
ncbi:MAG: hypothetical protein QOD51_918, partial [Candidatus Eremiobacteraeota bacterium]|nr:hypothetical protein [Candidatus Eremiobacteraeota bacterium]